MSKAGARFPTMFPKFLEEGVGSHVWDVDGNRYIDWSCALGAVSLGYGGVESCGYESMSLPSPLEAEVAQLIVENVAPWAESVRFVTTGSEACQAAVRIARRFTKREHVIVVGYHGWHDWVQVTSEKHPGVPECYAQVITRIPYGNLKAVEEVMKDFKVAAVMLEPTLLAPPPSGYLQDLRTLCTLHGAMLIFDEMVMGFRWAVGGGSEFFNIEPDLATYGKALGNGYPIACVVGARDVMKKANVISGTFGGNLTSLDAARQVIEAYKDPGKIQAQWKRGGEFLQACRLIGIPVTGYPVHPKIEYPEPQMSLFLQETARRGLLLHPGGLNVSVALTQEDMETTSTALREAKEAMDQGVLLDGEPGRPGLLQRIA